LRLMENFQPRYSVRLGEHTRLVCSDRRPRRYVFSDVAAGVSPAVEPGILPGGTTPKHDLNRPDICGSLINRPLSERFNSGDGNLRVLVMLSPT